MRSKYVRREWEYALSLNRPYFVRPTYWEDPLPRDATLGLPPTALSSLHFYRLALEAAPTPRPGSCRGGSCRGGSDRGGSAPPVG